MVQLGWMPQPKRVFSRLIWGRQRLDAAFTDISEQRARTRSIMLAAEEAGSASGIFLCRTWCGLNACGFVAESVQMSKFLVNVQEITGERAVLTYVNTTARKLPTMIGHVDSIELAGNFQVTVSLQGLDHLLQLRRQSAVDRAKIGL